MCANFYFSTYLPKIKYTTSILCITVAKWLNVTFIPHTHNSQTSSPPPLPLKQKNDWTRRKSNQFMLFDFIKPRYLVQHMLVWTEKTVLANVHIRYVVLKRVNRIYAQMLYRWQCLRIYLKCKTVIRKKAVKTI